MTLTDRAQRFFGRGAFFLLLNRLFREQQQQRLALERLDRTLEQIGRILAKNSGVPWGDYHPRTPDDQFTDHSSIASPDDDTLAAYESIEEDYHARFGRAVPTEEILKVFEDHRSIREEP